MTTGLFDMVEVMFFVRILALLLLAVVARYVYRLTLHPLAKFPGPKRAAVSSLYGAWWDVPLQTSFVREFTKWHDIYKSDVIRIAPNQLHIRDWGSYNEIFKMGSKFGRDPSFYQFPLSEGSFWTNTNIKDGLSHRSLYHQYFSRHAVQKLEPSFQKELSRMLMTIEDMRKRNEPIDLTLAFRCFSADTVGSYMFDQSFGFLDSPDFRDPTLLQLEEVVKLMPASWYFGKSFAQLIRLLSKMPRSWIGTSGVSATLKVYDMCAARLKEMSQRPPTSGSPNIFQTALNPATEKEHPKVSLEQLFADALVFFTAGSESTANMLSYCVYHLHQNPSYLQALRVELATAIPHSATISATIPDPSTFPISWTELEKLPLLRAAVKETLRISYGVPGKLPRIVPTGGAVLGGRLIPEGTVVSSCTYVHHNDAAFYPRPLEFRPERWLVDENAEGYGRFRNNDGVDPEKYLTTFSRGSRNCLGINLAYAELYSGVAYLLRNYELELFEVKPEDMDWHDSFVAAPFGHLKVKISGLVD